VFSFMHMDIERKRFEVNLVSRCREMVRDYLTSGEDGKREEVLRVLADTSWKLTSGLKYQGEVQRYIAGINNGTLRLPSENR